MICKKYIYFLTTLVMWISTCCKSKTNNSLSGRDFYEIMESGEIKALTLSGSMSYFIYKGAEMGYQYELIKNFADANNLRLKIIIANNETELREMLETGKGDIIACNFPVTNEGKEKFLYCGEESINEQVLVQRSNKGDTLLNDIPDLIGKNIWVIHDTKYYSRLLNLNNESGGGINIHSIDKDTVSVEDLIEMVANGEIPYTVSDLDLAKLNKTYYSNINIALKISHPQRSSWMVDKRSPKLAENVNEWFKNNSNTTKYRAIIKRYFEMSKLPGDAPAPIISNKAISVHDKYFKQYAPKIPWDWRLLASIAYQESKFYVDKVSWAGATGLMGIMPKTAETFNMELDRLIDPESSVETATKLIKRLNKHFSSIENEEERIKFILASYNGGLGHVTDAQALAEKYGKDPHVWEDNVLECLKLKKLPEYYNDPVCKSGYFRGTESIAYVKAVMERWKYYQEKVEE
ncbi:MAG: transporter substrate-binding domain-containing protein [Dysgonamonadaceae bacterium]|nr:transporter substrate-binding domain-containing protein [Dysgonamonadaceae bacterium]